MVRHKVTRLLPFAAIAKDLGPTRGSVVYHVEVDDASGQNNVNPADEPSPLGCLGCI